MSAAPLVARAARLGPAYDLAAAYRPGSGFCLDRGGLGVAADGSAARIVVPPGPEQVARAASAVRAAFSAVERSHENPAPVAVGALPFAGATDAVLVIPKRAVRRTVLGETWRVDVARPGADDADRDEPPAGRGAPHDPFEEIQVHPVPAPEAYAQAVGRAVEGIRGGEVRKVVLARSVEVEADRTLDPKKLLRRLRAVDPGCFAFAVPVEPGAKTLVGASPELLVARHGLEARSTPLAGSAPRSGDPGEDRELAETLRASAKDRLEHELVVEAVLEALAPLCEELERDPEPVLLGTANVWHLATRFRGRLREPAPSALELAAALHPTPAVCGTPRDAAMQEIVELEPFDRGCYAGPVGWVDADGDGEWAIALRCAEISGSRARLFAGAGIVAGSEPARELEETERKFRALLDSLRWG